MNDSNNSDLQHPIEWAMETDLDPFFMLADWLVRDAIADSDGAVSTLTSPETSLNDFRTLKRIFKHLRVEGETPADRRLGAHLYAASISGALVFHERLITVQSRTRLGRAFEELRGASDLPEELTSLGANALTALDTHPE